MSRGSICRSTVDTRSDASEVTGHREPVSPGAAGQPVVDAHHHLWDLQRHVYPWLSGGGDPGTTEWIGDYGAIRRSFLVGDYVRETAASGVIKSVHIEAVWGGSDSLGETAWLQSVAAADGLPTGIVAGIDLRSPDAEAQLDAHMACERFRGVRMAEMGDLVTDSDFRRGFAWLAERGLCYDINITAEDAVHALGLAAAFPATTIIVDNMANPRSLRLGTLRRWVRAMEPLAQAPNVVMKVSGLGMADHHWSIQRIRPWVLEAFRIFTPARCMFGSNWPVDGLYSSYAALVGALRGITGELRPAEREAFFRGTAERCYRI